MEIEVGADRDGQRLDVILSQEGNMSRRAARRLIEGGSVFVDAKRTRVQSRLVESGAVVKWSENAFVPVETPVAIVHQGNDFFVANKPAGMPTEPTRQASVGTLVETLRKALRTAEGVAPTIAAVHRLDSDTTGVVLLATTPQSAAAWSEPFRSGSVERRYLALVDGDIEDTVLRIDAPLAKAREPGRMIVDAAGKASKTIVTALARGRGKTLVSVVPRTGRTHQIRVHLAHVGHPIVGDMRYASSTFAHAEQTSTGALPFCLHAHSLMVKDPRDDVELRVSAPLPEAFVDACLASDIPREVITFVDTPPWEMT